MSTRTTVEAIAAVVNELREDVAAAREVMTDRALAVLIADRCPATSRKDVMAVLNAIEKLPETMLTPFGRAIRIREDTE